mgnify:CR=1 FL=1
MRAAHANTRHDRPKEAKNKSVYDSHTAATLQPHDTQCGTWSMLECVGGPATRRRQPLCQLLRGHPRRPHAASAAAAASCPQAANTRRSATRSRCRGGVPLLRLLQPRRPGAHSPARGACSRCRCRRGSGGG